MLKCDKYWGIIEVAHKYNYCIHIINYEVCNIPINITLHVYNQHVLIYDYMLEVSILSLNKQIN